MTLDRRRLWKALSQPHVGRDGGCGANAFGGLGLHAGEMTYKPFKKRLNSLAKAQYLISAMSDSIFTIQDISSSFAQPD